MTTNRFDQGLKIGHCLTWDWFSELTLKAFGNKMHEIHCTMNFLNKHPKC